MDEAMRERIGCRHAAKSRWVKTPATPGRAKALVTSIRLILPCGRELRYNAACSMPSMCPSST